MVYMVIIQKFLCLIMQLSCIVHIISGPVMAPTSSALSHDYKYDTHSYRNRIVLVTMALHSWRICSCRPVNWAVLSQRAPWIVYDLSGRHRSLSLEYLQSPLSYVNPYVALGVKKPQARGFRRHLSGMFYYGELEESVSRRLLQVATTENSNGL